MEVRGRRKKNHRRKGQAVRMRSTRRVEFFVATDIGRGLGAVIGKEAGALKSIPGNEARIAQAWIDVGGCLRVFDVYTWHSEGWTARNEALMEAGGQAMISHKTSVVRSV